MHKDDWTAAMAGFDATQPRDEDMTDDPVVLKQALRTAWHNMFVLSLCLRSHAETRMASTAATVNVQGSTANVDLNPDEAKP